MFPRARAFVVSLKRSFSSSAGEDRRFLQISMRKDMAEEFCDKATKYYDKFSDVSFSVNPLALRECESATKVLHDLIKKDKKMDEAFRASREDGCKVVLVDGAEVPEIAKSDIPRSAEDVTSKSFAKKIRPAQVISYAYGRMLGISPQLVTGGDLITGVYATEAESESVSSYRSSKELKWHNDGWASGRAIPKLFLVGVVGKEGVFTEVAFDEDIINYFVKNGREDLLRTLSQEHMVDDGEFTPITIIDREKKEVNYAQYGNFSPRYDAFKFYESIEFLNKALEESPALRINIQNGQILALSNREVLHRKVTDPAATTGSAVGQRLLLRGLGEEAEL